MVKAGRSGGQRIQEEKTGKIATGFKTAFQRQRQGQADISEFQASHGVMRSCLKKQKQKTKLEWPRHTSDAQIYTQARPPKS